MTRICLRLLKKSSQFIVPIYQRVYSWKERSARSYGRTFCGLAATTARAHFTGSIVYVAKDQATNTSAEPDLIIDGQQRVTTVTLLLAALAERLEQLPENEREPLDGFSPKKIRNRYLLNDDEEGERQFKLILSQERQASTDRDRSDGPNPRSRPRPCHSRTSILRGKFDDPSLDLATFVGASTSSSSSM